MHKTYNPEAAGMTTPTHSHAVETRSGTRNLHISGQIGMDASGNIGRDAKEQSTFIFQNIAEVLKAAEMSIDNLVLLRCYLVEASDLPAFREVRASFLSGRRPASTLVIVRALADPRLLVEVEALASA